MAATCASAASNGGGPTPTVSPTSTGWGSAPAPESSCAPSGFASSAGPPTSKRTGLALQVNGVHVFARGAVWTPVPGPELRGTLVQLRDAGLNLIRVVGTTVYESAAFHDLCDELGLLVWQDLMFANMDYPIADPAFRALVEPELRQALGQVAGRPSLAVVCGNSEVEQQVGMLGLDPELGRGEFFDGLIPSLVAEAGIDAVYIPSAPTGGEQPFRTDRGVANYFGVGAYLRPLDDVRRAAVRFASECLAFANVPESQPGTYSRRGHARRRRGLGLRRRSRPLPRAARMGSGATIPTTGSARGSSQGEVMAEVFGEWRRAGSVCGGGIVLWSRDLVPGAGWGILDEQGGRRSSGTSCAERSRRSPSGRPTKG